METDNIALIAQYLGRIAVCLEKICADKENAKNTEPIPILPPKLVKGKKRAFLYYKYRWTIGAIWEYENPNKKWDSLGDNAKAYYTRLISDSLKRYELKDVE